MDRPHNVNYDPAGRSNESKVLIDLATAAKKIINIGNGSRNLVKRKKKKNVHDSLLLRLFMLFSGEQMAQHQQHTR